MTKGTILILASFRLHLVNLAIAKYREPDSLNPLLARAIETYSHSNKYICFFKVKCTSIISLVCANYLLLPAMILYPEAFQLTTAVAEDFDV